MPDEWLTKLREDEELWKLRKQMERERIASIAPPESPQPVQQPQFIPAPQETQPQWQPQFIPQVEEALPFEPQPVDWMQQTQIQSPVRQPVIPPMEEAPKPEEKPVQWWEKPAELYGKGEEALGKAIAGVPILPKALEFVAPAFKWIYENLEKPWASVILDPFVPDLAWEKNESWITHKKREYDAWESPTYVKGLAEFSMPLWWIPYFGWAAKGAKALGAGAKVMKGIATAEKISGIPSKMITLPADALLNKVLFKPTNIRKFAQFGQKIPGVKQAIEVIGGPGVFLKADTQAPIDIAKRSYVKNMGQLRSMASGVENQIIPHLQVIDNGVGFKKVLGISDDGILSNIVPKNAAKSKYLGDVLEGALNHPDDYSFLTKGAKEYVDTYRTALDVINKLRKENGLEIPKEYKYHRMVEGKWADGKLEKSEFGSRFEDPRVHETMAEAIAKPDPTTGRLNGVAYGLDPTDSLATTIDHYITSIAKKRFTDEVNTLGKTASEKWSAAFPIEDKRIDDLIKQQSSAKYANSALKRIASYKGQSVPGAVIQKIRDELPQVGTLLDDALNLTMPEMDRIITSMGREIRDILKVNPKEFKLQMASAEGKTLLQKAANTLVQGAKDQVAVERVVEFMYKKAQSSRRNEFKVALETVRNNLDMLLNTTKNELSPLMAQRRAFLNHYRGRGQIFGGEAKILHPAFGDRIFPKDVSDFVTRQLRDKSQKWLEDARTASGLSRMLTATLDTSAAFIQGAYLLTTNPVAWAQSVGRMLEFGWNPKTFLKYLTDPTVIATRAERIAAGGSSGSFEFFEAMKPLQNLAGKVPKAGGGLQKGLQQVFGRADVLFEGFGEVARNKMWMAMRHKAVSPETAMELARTLDRMTGVMSTSALGIGKTQQDIESAFGFFSPRYTRAGMAFAGDVLKGGLSGQVARTSIAEFLGGGLAMYYGTAKALGQAPDLNPSSGRFLTIKIGNQHLGIGGIAIALMRLNYDIAVTAIQNPADLVKPFNESGVNRWDNPFIKFMYSRTAPLTSFGISAIVEQADYYGEPFESVADWANFIKDKVSPIALQDITTAGPVGVAGQLAGLRQFPKSPSELLADERDRIAKSQKGVAYDTLDDLNKRQVNASPTVVKLQEDVDASTVQRGDEQSLAFLNRKREMDNAREAYVQRLTLLQKAYDDGIIDGYGFKEEMSKAGYGLGATYEHINRQPEYQAIMKKLQSGDMPDKTKRDLARIEFSARSADMEDQYGMFDFEKYEALKQEIRQKYGEDAYQYVLEYKREKDKELPPLAQEYQKAKEIMQPYWEVQSKVEKMFGKTYAASPYGQRLITKLRKTERLKNPELEAAYKKFYSQT